MQLIWVINPKGGSGKTTVSTNLAAYYARRGKRVQILDFDPQGSSMYWCSERPENLAPIICRSPHSSVMHATESWNARVERDVDVLIVDTPAGLDVIQHADRLRKAHKIIIPVVPSKLDIHAVSRCIADLLLRVKFSGAPHRIGVVANRSNKQTLAYTKLQRFLTTLSIPYIATLRDSQSYARAVEEGMSIFDMQPSTVIKDLASWDPILSWLATKSPMHIRDDYQTVARLR